MNARRHEAAPMPVARVPLGARASGVRRAFPGHVNPDPKYTDEDRQQ